MKQTLSLAIKQSVNLIKTKKPVIALLLIIQLVFFAALISVSFKTLVPAMASYMGLQDYMGSIDLENVDPESPLTSGMLGDDPLIIYRNYKQIRSNVIIFISLLFASFVLINGSAWYAAKSLLKKKNFKEYILRFTALSAAYFILSIFLLFAATKNIMLGGAFASIKALLLLLLLAALNYFIFIAFALNKPLKQTVKAAFKLGAKNAKILIPTFLINLAVKIIIIIILSFMLEKISIFITTFMLLVFTSSFVWARLLLNVVISKLKN